MLYTEEELSALTLEYGGTWGLNHSKRLLRLIEIIGEGIEYNHEVVITATYMHDFGAYRAFVVDGVDHSKRSVEVALEFLQQRSYSSEFIENVLECIEYHHSDSQEISTEAKLLRDADALDFLGVIGILRDFSKKPNELKKAYEQVQIRKQNLPNILYFLKSQEIGKERIQQMEEVLSIFLEESFGYY